jgi:hypothetical protein
VTKVTYNLTRNADDTLTIRVGRQIEVIELLYKDRGQIFEDVKWRLVSKGIVISDLALTHDLYELVWRQA